MKFSNVYSQIWPLTSKGEALEIPKTSLYLFFVIELLIALLFSLIAKPFVIFLIVIGIIFLFFSLTSFHNFLYLMLLYVCVIPIHAWAKRYDFFQVYVSYKLIYLLLIILFLFWFVKSLKTKSLTIIISNLDIAFLIFFLFVLIGAINGLQKGIRSEFLISELLILFMYGTYVLYVNYNPEREDIKKLWVAFFLITVIVSIQYILVFLSEFSIFEVGIKRITTRQPHLALITLPLIYSTILLSDKKTEKIIVTLGIFPIFLMVIISQQRGLWLGVIFSFFVFVIFSILRTKINFKKVMILLLVLLIFVGLFAAAVTLLQNKIKSSSTYTLSQRVGSLQNLETDYSLFIRFVEIKQALKQVGNLSFFGAGIGKHITRFANQTYSNIVDNSYFYIYWKLGWMGVLSFLSIYFLFLYRCIRVLFKSNNKLDQIISLSAISGMCGLFLVALTNISLVLYRFNLVWGLVIASIEILYRFNKSKSRDKY